MGFCGNMPDRSNLEEEELIVLTFTFMEALILRREQFCRVKACITEARREGRRKGWSEGRREGVYTGWA